MKLGRVFLAGANAWPDNLLDWGCGSLLGGLVLQVRAFAIGFEVHGGPSNPWLAIYLGFWAFEIFIDVDGSWQEADG